MLKPDPERFQALQQYPVPINIKQLNSLIGFFAYYAKWIPNCTNLTTILTNSRDSISKNIPLPDEAISAIKQLKDQLTTASLATPYPNILFKIETDPPKSQLVEP